MRNAVQRILEDEVVINLDDEVIADSLVEPFVHAQPEIHRNVEIGPDECDIGSGGNIDVGQGLDVYREEVDAVAIDSSCIPLVVTEGVNQESGDVPSIPEPQLGFQLHCQDQSILEQPIHVNSGGDDGIPNLDADFVTPPLLGRPRVTQKEGLKGRVVVELGSTSGNGNMLRFYHFLYQISLLLYGLLYGVI